MVVVVVVCQDMVADTPCGFPHMVQFHGTVPVRRLNRLICKRTPSTNWRVTKPFVVRELNVDGMLVPNNILDVQERCMMRRQTEEGRRQKEEGKRQ